MSIYSRFPVLIAQLIVSSWQGWNAEVVAAINNWLEGQQHRERNPELIATISNELKTA